MKLKKRESAVNNVNKEMGQKQQICSVVSDVASPLQAPESSQIPLLTEAHWHGHNSTPPTIMYFVLFIFFLNIKWCYNISLLCHFILICMFHSTNSLFIVYWTVVYTDKQLNRTKRYKTIIYICQTVSIPYSIFLWSLHKDQTVKLVCTAPTSRFQCNKHVTLSLKLIYLYITFAALKTGGIISVMSLEIWHFQLVNLCLSHFKDI